MTPEEWLDVLYYGGGAALIVAGAVIGAPVLLLISLGKMIYDGRQVAQQALEGGGVADLSYVKRLGWFGVDAVLMYCGGRPQP